MNKVIFLISFFCWDISVICPIIILKFTITVFTGLPFLTLWLNWLNFFSVISRTFSLAYDWKNKPSLQLINLLWACMIPWDWGRSFLISILYLALATGSTIFFLQMQIIWYCIHLLNKVLISFDIIIMHLISFLLLGTKWKCKSGLKRMWCYTSTKTQGCVRCK